MIHPRKSFHTTKTCFIKLHFNTILKLLLQSLSKSQIIFSIKTDNMMIAQNICKFMITADNNLKCDVVWYYRRCYIKMVV